MTAKECPESGTHRSLKSTLALWAGRIALIAIAGVISILSGLSLVMRFFGATKCGSPQMMNPSMRKRTTHWRAAKVQRGIVLYSPNG